MSAGPSSDSDLRSDEARTQILAEVRLVLEQTAAYLVRTAAYERSDRLWPGEQELYTTNPLSLAYGACGPALLLHELDRLPAQATEWILGKPVTAEEYPPGLYLGLGGIAYSLER